MFKFSSLSPDIKLRPHQEAAINKFLHNKNRQIFAHSLGSGKTITSIGAVERSGGKKALILTPAALQKNYIDTINKIVTKDSIGKYKVMSYEKFRMNPNKFINDIKPDTLVVDEYHRHKDPTGKSFKSLQVARGKVKNFIGLTGTVMQNHPSEIFPLLNLSRGSNDIGLDSKNFNRKYTEIKKVYPKGIKGLFARVTGRYGERRVLKNQDALKNIFKNDIDKNLPTKEFLSNFPKKEFVEINTPMTRQQSKVYDYFMSKDLNAFDRWRIRNNLPPKVKDSQKFFSKLMHARQAAISPISFNKKYRNTGLQSSGKLTVSNRNLMNHLKSDPVNKALIYSNFIDSSIDPISKSLAKSNISFGEFSGRVSKKLRNQAVTDFNAGKRRVLIASPSGAEGLDLKGVTLLQNLDPHWNPAKMSQIYGRAARFKSHDLLPPEKRKVRIELYKSYQKPSLIGRLFGKRKKTTVDDYIYNRAKEKRDLIKQVETLI
jgi:SNF2 family DNA or RNA helicase